MSGWRHPTLGASIDRETTLTFTFDGQSMHGFAGDTLASAVLATGTRVLGRSIKYHRPRGLWGMGADEPNAIFDVRYSDVRLGDVHLPNQRATTTWLQEGMDVSSVNANPTARRDRLGWMDKLHQLLPAGFYYKTFMALNWSRYEPFIRRMAGLGKVDQSYLPPADAPQINASCDLLVIGAGPAGLAAAKAAAEVGRSVWLVDSGTEPGGSLHRRGGVINGASWQVYANQCIKTIQQSGGRFLSNTTVWGVFDHKLFAAWTRNVQGPDRHLRIRAQETVIATGAIERPMWFANNDLPGVMSSEAALHFLNCYGVVAGQRIVIATANDASYAVADALVKAGSQVTVVDQRADAPAIDGVTQYKDNLVTAAIGKNAVTAAAVNGREIACDTILCSGGYTPTVHLWCQDGGKLDWNASLDALVPRASTSELKPVGATAGQFGLAAALSAGHDLFLHTAAPATSVQNPRAQAPVRPNPELPGRQWIDLQNDVTLKDVGLAAREGYTSVEHLKRYTTLSMATDQGRTSNFAGLAAMAAVTARTIPKTGTTTYRPPFEPVPFSVIAGRRRGELFNPPKRLQLEAVHKSMGARFREYGGWLRPAVYGTGPEHDLAQQQALAARTTAAIFDASPLGKLEVIGPAAAQLLDFTGYMRMSTLAPGRARYGFMLAESGILYDDGVVFRISENRFIVSASSSHVDGVRFRLEDARQDRFGRRQVVIHDVTQALVTLTVTGPKALEVMEHAGIDCLDLPHMGVVETHLDNQLLRIARISFTGDRSYELSVSARHAEALCTRLDQSLETIGGQWIGLESLMILRAEQGYVLVGKDTDGNTMPHDLGWDGPMKKREDEFLGKRALFTPAGRSLTRRQLVGLKVPTDSPPLETGSHLVPITGARRSLGFVTSSYHSPNLNRPIALAMLESGFTLMDQQIGCFNDGRIRKATVTPACAFDPSGSRLDG